MTSYSGFIVIGAVYVRAHTPINQPELKTLLNQNQQWTACGRLEHRHQDVAYFLRTWEHTDLGRNCDCRHVKIMRDLPIARAVSIVATLTLSRKFGPGKTARAGKRIRRGGGEAYGLEPRVAKLEATTAHIQRDVTELKTALKTEIRGLRSEARANLRLLLGANVSVAVGLGGLMAKGFGWY